MFNNPEWVNSAIRQIVALIGIFIVALDILPAAQWEQLAAAFVSVALVIYDVLRTKDLADENVALKEANLLFQTVNDEQATA